jgi:hypothetical protein
MAGLTAFLLYDREDFEVERVQVFDNLEQNCTLTEFRWKYG